MLLEFLPDDIEITFRISISWGQAQISIVIECSTHTHKKVQVEVREHTLIHFRACVTITVIQSHTGNTAVLCNSAIHKRQILLGCTHQISQGQTDNCKRILVNRQNNRLQDTFQISSFTSKEKHILIQTHNAHVKVYWSVGFP